jgi:hypothetical protein
LLDSHGGQFEFLPVTVKSGSVIISAVLRIGIHCGVEVVTPETPFLGVVGPTFQAGIEVAVFAHVGEFITNVTVTPDNEDCKLQVVQEYNMALGAVAGASVVVDLPGKGLLPRTWGPVIEKSIAVFTTTLAKVCASSGKPEAAQASITAPGVKRQDLTTTTMTSVVVTSGVSCNTPKLTNCPVSAQNTTMATFTRYHTTAIPSGITPTWPETMTNSVQSKIPFGKRVQTIVAMSGSPTAYTAPPTPTDSGSGNKGGLLHPSMDGEDRGISKRIGLGVGIGLGLPALIVAIIGIVL